MAKNKKSKRVRPAGKQRSLPRRSARLRAHALRRGRLRSKQKPTPAARAEVYSLDQPVGFRVEGWRQPPRPPRDPMIGRTCRVEPLDPAVHGAQLYAANALGGDGRNWTYLSYGPFATLDDYMSWLNGVTSAADPMFHAIVDLATNEAVGVASYLRIDPVAGSIEVGHINYSPKLQRTVAATEAMYVMMKRAFELGYRRYEWKCNALNAASRAAAQRLRFSVQGRVRP